MVSDEAFAHEIAPARTFVMGLTGSHWIRTPQELADLAGRIGSLERRERREKPRKAAPFSPPTRTSGSNLI